MLDDQYLDPKLAGFDEIRKWLAQCEFDTSEPRPRHAEDRGLIARLHDRGLRPITISPPGCGLPRAGKSPAHFEGGMWKSTPGWNDLQSPYTPAKLATLQRDHERGAGIGIQLGQGIIGLDFDIPDRAIATAMEAEARRILADPAHPDQNPLRFKRIGNAPKSLFLVRYEGGPFKSRTSAAYEIRGHKCQIELMGLKRGPAGWVASQAVLFGVHPTTMKPYSWPVLDPMGLSVERTQPSIGPKSDLPTVTAEQLDQLIATFSFIAETDGGRHIGKASGEAADHSANHGNAETVSLDTLSQIMAFIPPTQDYHTWRDVATAMKRSLAPGDWFDGFLIFEEWSARAYEDPQPDGSQKKPNTESGQTPQELWDRTNVDDRQGARTIRSLIWEARKHGYRTAYERSAAGEDFDKIDPDDAAGAGGARPGNSAKQTRKLIAQFADDLEPDFAQLHLIDNFIEVGSFTVLYGDSNSGKTFAALDMAFRIARGEPWADRKTHKGGVLYIAAEGGNSVKKRVKALRKKFGLAGKLFKVITQPVDMLRPAGDMDAVIAAVREMEAETGAKVELVIFDTLSRVLAGGNENDSVDMGALVRNVDAVRYATAAATMLIHHTGKDAAKKARGHSSLKAAVDTEIEVAYVDAVRSRLFDTKQRDMPLGARWICTREVVEIGAKPDGSPVTSCVLHWKAEAPAEAKADERFALKGSRELTFVRLIREGITDANEHRRLWVNSEVPRKADVAEEKWLETASEAWRDVATTLEKIRGAIVCDRDARGRRTVLRLCSEGGSGEG